MWRIITGWLVIFCLWLPWPALADSGYSTDELDKLVGPIALYPDPLLDTVVAAAAQPDQLRAANQAIAQGQSSPSTNWDESVQAVYSYPDVVSMMNKNQEWTRAVGWAGVNQVGDLMDAVQRFRYQAQTAGNLQTNDKVQVIEEGTTVRIEPANPEIIYVPTYMPQTIIVEDDSDDYDALVAWGLGVATTSLLWSSMYHWGSGCWYHPPYGWRPGVAHYGAYGWQGSGIYNRNNVWNRSTNINRPININNINTGNIFAGNRPGNRPGGGNRPGTGHRPSASPRPAERPAVSQSGAWGGQSGLNGSRPNFPSQRPSSGSFPSTGYSRPSGGFSSQHSSSG
ncbi:DUF3300 domain-containing protein, partial [bacterium]|nr:DUF3300 domain-containing protein [bacterium]